MKGDEENRSIPYTQEDLNLVWSILERLGVQKPDEISLDDIKIASYHANASFLENPWGEILFSLDSSDNASSPRPVEIQVPKNRQNGFH